MHGVGTEAGRARDDSPVADLHRAAAGRRRLRQLAPVGLGRRRYRPAAATAATGRGATTTGATSAGAPPPA